MELFKRKSIISAAEKEILKYKKLHECLTKDWLTKKDFLERTVFNEVKLISSFVIDDYDVYIDSSLSYVRDETAIALKKLYTEGSYEVPKPILYPVPKQECELFGVHLSEKLIKLAALKASIIKIMSGVSVKSILRLRYPPIKRITIIDVPEVYRSGENYFEIRDPNKAIMMLQYIYDIVTVHMQECEDSISLIKSHMTNTTESSS